MEEKYIDKSINPGEDFFKYATGNWLKHNPQKPEYPSWGVFTKLSDDNIKKINKIIQTPDDSEISKKIHAYYNIVSNWDRRNADGLKPMMTFLFRNVYTLFSKEDIFEFCAKEKCFPFFSVYLDVDMDDSSKYIVEIGEDGLSLNNKEYYLSKDPDKRKVMRAWKRYVISLYKAYGKTDEEAKAKHKFILGIEKKIAKHVYSEEDSQNPANIWHPTTVAKASKKYKFDFSKYLDLYGYDSCKDINIINEDHLKFVCKLFEKLSVEELKTIIEWQFMNQFSICGGDDIFKITHRFKKSITGAKRQMPKKKRAINAVNKIFGDAIGQIYVQRYFSEDSKKDVKALVEKLVISYKNIICEQTWMSDETKKLAIEKLNNIGMKLGYPDTIDDYSDIPVDESLSFFENKYEVLKYFFEKDKEKHYNKPVDKTEWGMYPHMVNAYYHPTLNEICFPAGILQPPFYDPAKSYAENLGSIGVIIGHEMTHGYDNHGRQFDINGNLKMWWKEEEIEKFNKLCETTKKHFDNIEAIPGVKCDGGLTLSENLADYGGLKIAYNALMMDPVYKKDIKKFFISYAQCWAFTATDEAIKTQILTNEHSVDNVRVNGTLPMFTPWYDAFNIKDSDPLYVKPENRAKIW